MFKFLKSLFGENQQVEVVPNSSTAVLNQANSQAQPKRAGAHANQLDLAACSGPCVELPIQQLMNCLPEELRRKLARPAKRTDVIRLPTATALDQLPRGAVKVSFAQLKLGAPEGLFHDSSDLDNTTVELPLGEILPRLGAGCLIKRPNQQRTTIPDDIAGVFKPRGAKQDEPIPIAPTPDMDRFQESQAIARFPEAHAKRPVSYDLKAHADVLPAIKNTLPIPAIAPEPARPAETLQVSLSDVSRDWPQEFKSRLSRYSGASLQIPFCEIEAAMKKGRAVFSWQQLHSWLLPQIPANSTEYDTMMLKVPLSLLVPQFMALRSPSGTHKKIAVGDEIPDLFQVRNESSSGAISIDVRHRHQPEAHVPLARKKEPHPCATQAANLPSLGNSLRVQPGKAHAPEEPMPSGSSALPADIVRHACQLSGVTGAILATTDGLVIAGELPPELDPEAVAGFLPELYGRLRQYTQELKLGDPNQVELLAGELPLLINKTNSAYFAVVGRDGEPLPKLQLKALAWQLNALTR
jgi:predicted regulator of Ras-like GTPase activity (Roadblock/LC7/MglB family)